MASYADRNAARGILFDARAYADQGAGCPTLQEQDWAERVLAQPFEFTSLAELVQDAIEGSESGLSDYDSPGQEVQERYILSSSHITHEIVQGRHRLVVDSKLGAWVPGNRPAWCGEFAATLDVEGNPRVFRAVPVENVQRVEA